MAKKSGGLGAGTPKRVRQITGGKPTTARTVMAPERAKNKRPGRPALEEPHTLKTVNLADSQIARLESYLTEQKKAGVKGLNMAVIVRELIEQFLVKEGY